jgi:hypothetical protein
MPASSDRYRKEREYTSGGDLLFHASVGPSGAMTISGSQAAFVPVRRKGWHAGLMDGGWVSLFEHFTGQLGQEAEDGRYPAGPATWTFRTARGGGVHLEFSVPTAASPALAITVQPVYEQFALAAEEFQARVDRADRDGWPAP